MADRPVRVARRAAIRIGDFTFDRTHPAEKACADYIRAALPGTRATRMKRLILAGHAALRARHARFPHNDHEG